MVTDKFDLVRSGQLSVRRQRIERWVHKDRSLLINDKATQSLTSIIEKPTGSAFFQSDRLLYTHLFQLAEQREKLIEQHNYHQKLFANKQALRHKDNEAVLSTLNYVRKCCKYFELNNNTEESIDPTMLVEEKNTNKTIRSRPLTANTPKMKRNLSSNDHRQNGNSLAEIFFRHNKKHIEPSRKLIAEEMPLTTQPTVDDESQQHHVQFEMNTKRSVQSAHVSNKKRSLADNKQYNRNAASAHGLQTYEIPKAISARLIKQVDHSEEQIKPLMQTKRPSSRKFPNKTSLEEFRRYPERFVSESNRYLPLLRRQATGIESNEFYIKQQKEKTDLLKRSRPQFLSSTSPLSGGSDVGYDDATSFLSEEVETGKSVLNSHIPLYGDHDLKSTKQPHISSKIDLMETNTTDISERTLAISRLRDRQYAHLHKLIRSNSIEHILEPLSANKQPKSKCLNDILHSIDSLRCSTTFNKHTRQQSDIDKNLSKLGEDSDMVRRSPYEDENEAMLFNNDIAISIPMVPINNGTSEDAHPKKRNSVTVVNVTTINKSNQLQPEVREQWSEKLDFLLSIIGFAVDLANIWRFPYLCYKNGGGAFLIPYALSVILGGMPLFYLELLLGQYYRQGAITCWKKICPLLAGIGWAVTIIAFYTDFYYNVVISWGLYYLFASFKRILPWSQCNNLWNTKDCSTVDTRRIFLETCMNDLNNTINSTEQFLEPNFLYENCSEKLTRLNKASPAQEYFHLQVYRLKPERNLSLGSLGGINWENLACLGIIYLICYFSMWKGVKTSGKVVWFTALFPYVVLTILMVRGLFLNGSMKGIEYYIRPDLSKLNDASVWVDAASQTFFSLGPGFGVLMAFASYNDFHHNVYRDAMITVAVNSLTSFASGFVIFMFLGYMSEISGREIKDVAEQGSTLVFIVYPEAIATMPWAPVWAIFFFLMLLTLGLDSSFGGSEAIITALSDVFPVLRRHREWFVGALFFFYFLIGIPSCTDGGVYFVELLQNYAAFYSIIIAVLFEAIAVSWLYGINRISEDVKEMLGSKPGKFWIVTWCVAAPLFLGGIVLSGLIQHVHPTYGKLTDPFYYRYPDWSHLVGWVFAVSSVIFIPIVAIYQLLIERGSLLTRFRLSIIPWKDREKHLNPDIIISTNLVGTQYTSEETN